MNIDSLESILEFEMANRDVYDQKKKLKIQAHQTIANYEGKDENQKIHYIFRLIEEFEKYSFDSTLFYSEKVLAMAESLSDQVIINKSKLNIARVLGNAGRSKEAEDVLKEIKMRDLEGLLLIDYCNTARKLFEDLSYYAISESNKKKYKKLYRFYKDSLISLIDVQSDMYLSLKEKEFLDGSLLDQALEINTRRFSSARMGTRTYALIAFQRSLIFERKQDRMAQKESLMLSAISDIKSSVKDNASLAALANLLYHEGKIEKAYKYIQFAYQDALTYNSRLRFLEISSTFSLITAAYQKRSDNQTRMLYKYLFVISLLVLILVITLTFNYRQVKKLSQARKELRTLNDKLKDTNESIIISKIQLERFNLELSESNHVKEVYIANFLNIQSEYIDKIESYHKLVRKMLIARKFDDLLNRVNSQKYIESEVAEFYKTFDQTFLGIFPNFIKKLNELLEVDGRIELPEKDKLNTELRIFALIRLGIKDSSTIARLLRYSVNTIYNYRVKIKNKALVPRKDFEQLVERIDASSSEIT